MEDSNNPLLGPLHLGGALDIQRVVELRDILNAQPATPQAPFEIDLASVTRCDTAGVQLLCSARRSAISNGRDWRPQQPSEAVLRACSEVGIQREELGL